VWIADPTGWSARNSQKIKSRQDALQATLWVFIDIFYPPNWGCLKKTKFFNSVGPGRWPGQNWKGTQSHNLLFLLNVTGSSSEDTR
jgi:hypothetical protein